MWSRNDCLVVPAGCILVLAAMFYTEGQGGEATAEPGGFLEISKQVKTLVKGIVARYRDVPLEDKLIKSNPMQMLAEVSLLATSADPGIRKASLYPLCRLGQKSPTTELKRQCVERLCAALSDPDPLVREIAGDFVGRLFCGADFSDYARALIRSAVAEGIEDPGLFRVCGVAQVVDLRDYLRNLSPAEDKSKRALLLACARLGDDRAIAEVRRGIEQSRETRTPLNALSVMEEIDYVRREELLPILFEMLNSEERLPETRKNEEGEPLAVRAVGHLARMLEGFPVPANVGDAYTKQQVEQARLWVKQGGKYTIRR